MPGTGVGASKPSVKAAAIWDEVYGSDHCPVVVDLNV